MIGYILKEIYKKKQLVKYVIGGGTAATVDIFLLYVFTDIFNLWIVYSASLAFLSAFFVSFYIQKYWTFDDDNERSDATKQMIIDRKSTRLNSRHIPLSRMPSSA